MGCLDWLKGEDDMKSKFKDMMEMCGMVGFVEGLMEKGEEKGNENVEGYSRRLNMEVIGLKENVREGMKDGVVSG